jgi:hypothetical protein
MDYFNRVMVQRKLGAKKKNEKTLAQLIKTIQSKDAPEEILDQKQKEFL